MVVKAAFILVAAAMAIALAPSVVRAQSASEDWLPSQQHGIGFAKDPSGALITKVAKESAAERAGITEGMVITHIDGMPLRELTAIQIARLFAGSGSRLELKIRGSGIVTVNDASTSNSLGSAIKVGRPGY
jgi:S1-C subfamily serine protease